MLSVFFRTVGLAEIKEILEYSDFDKIIKLLKQAEMNAESKIAELEYSKAKIQRARKFYESKLQGENPPSNLFIKTFPQRVIHCKIPDKTIKCTVNSGIILYCVFAVSSNVFNICSRVSSVSSHAQNEQSIEGQLAECYNFAQRNDLRITHEYIDRALTGTTDKRPEFLQSNTALNLLRKLRAVIFRHTL